MHLVFFMRRITLILISLTRPYLFPLLLLFLLHHHLLLLLLLFPFFFHFLRDEGLLRCGKSCRLRWMNYLRPDIKRGNITPAEDDLIMRLHSLLGNRWSLIAGRLPGRTDNEIKNYWNTHLSKKHRSQGTNPSPAKKGTAGTKRRKAAKPASQARRKRSGVNGSRGEKPEVHLPKAIRLTSVLRRDSYGSNVAGESATSNQGSGQPYRDKSRDDAPSMACDHKDGQAQEGNRSEGVELAAERLQEEDGKDEEGLEKLYEEYLELLKERHGQDHHQNHLAELDCFAESLLI